MIRAPWSAEQVDKLNEYQRCDWTHPFTCGGDRRDDAHKAYALAHGEDMGQLVATAEGWACPVCSYRQDWAHAFMLEGAPPNPLAAFDG